LTNKISFNTGKVPQNRKILAEHWANLPQIGRNSPEIFILKFTPSYVFSQYDEEESLLGYKIV
jgi:hypothetical protein